MSNEKIIERVKKLLALAQSNNANESESAMLKAQEILAKHKLEMKDIEIKDNNNEVIEEQSDFEYTIRSQWKGNLAVVISENFGCDAFVSIKKKNGRKNKMQLCFIGEQENIEMVKVVYEYALKVCDERIKELQKENKRNGLSTSGIQQSYGMGFTRGLKDNYKEQLNKNKDWGLMVLKSEEVINYTNNKNLTQSKSKARYRQNEHFSNGYSDGKNFTTKNVLA